MTVQPVRESVVGVLPVVQYATNADLGAAAAAEAAEILRSAVAERGVANAILATGNSQLTFLEAIVRLPGIPWDRVNLFHMDEYVDLPAGHSASFPAFLRRHLVDKVHPKAFFPVRAEGDVEAGCREYEALLREHPADLTVMGIGENGHLAFNDPPYADFDDPQWVKTVKLDDRSRRQQVGEGHFGSLDEVPTHAVTVTIPALLAAKRVLVLVPESRKAEAVKASLLGPVTEDCPGSILREMAHAQPVCGRGCGRAPARLGLERGPGDGRRCVNGRERLLAALNHVEPDRVPYDLGSTQVTGIHEVAYRGLRDALGLPPVEPALCDEVQGLALPDDDLVDLLGVDVRGLFPLNSHNDSVARHATRVATGGGDEVEAFVDEWGITQHRPYPHGLYFTAVRHPLAGEIGPQDVARYPVARHGQTGPDRGSARTGARLPEPGPGGHD